MHCVSFLFVIFVLFSTTTISATLGVGVVDGIDIDPPAVRIYQVDERNKILKVLGDLPDSEVIIESVERIRLDCEATYPVQWIYTGNGVPILLTNIRKESEERYTASAFINTLKEHHTGNYACTSTEYPNIISSTSYFYIFVPGPLLFTASAFGNTVYIPKNDSRVVIPCSITNPSATVALEKAEGTVFRQLGIDNVKITYNPRIGFTIDLDGVNKPDSVYRCTARNNGIQRSKEYVVSYPSNKGGATSSSGMLPPSHLPPPPLPPQLILLSSVVRNYNDIFRLIGAGGAAAGGGSVAEFQSEQPHSESSSSNDPEKLQHCETHTDCQPNWSCYTDHTCKDPCINSIRCGKEAVCKYNDRRPYCECPADFVGDPMKECFNTLQGSDAEAEHPRDTPTTKRPTEESEPKPCRIDQHCGAHQKCIKAKCTDPCVSRLCARNAFCLTENHETSCQCNPGYFGDPNGILGCGPLKLQRPDPLKQKGQLKADTCTTNRDCPADQICRTHIGQLRACVEVCGTKICGVNSECQQANSTFDLPSCLCKDEYTGNPYLNCDEITNSRDCVIDNDCQSEERCQTGSSYRKCVHLCSRHTCPFNLECEAIDHEVRCICPPGFTGSEQIGCARDVSYDPAELPQGDAPPAAVASRSPEDPDVEQLVCSTLSCGPFSECRIEKGQPKCYCQAGYTGSPPRCRQECETTADCPGHKTCVQKRCRNVCRNRCAQNAFCRVGTTGAERFPICVCSEGYTGNAEVKCNRV